MAEVYENYRRCPSCDYWADKNKWSQLEVGSTNGDSYLICRAYNLEKKENTYIGSVKLLACPRCRTMIWER